MLATLVRGEFNLRGLQNKTLRPHWHEKTSAQVSRPLKRLRLRGLLKWEGSPALLETSFTIVPPEIRELRFRADAGFGYDPVLTTLETRRADYAVVARMSAGLKRLLPGFRCEPANTRWECAEGEFRAHGWRQARRLVVARRLIEEDDPQATLFAMGGYRYRAWVTDLGLTPAGVGHFYEGRAAMEPRIHLGRSVSCIRSSKKSKRKVLTSILRDDMKSSCDYSITRSTGADFG